MKGPHQRQHRGSKASADDKVVEVADAGTAHSSAINNSATAPPPPKQQNNNKGKRRVSLTSSKTGATTSTKVTGGGESGGDTSKTQHPKQHPPLNVTHPTKVETKKNSSKKKSTATEPSDPGNDTSSGSTEMISMLHPSSATSATASISTSMIPTPTHFLLDAATLLSPPDNQSPATAKPEEEESLLLQTTQPMTSHIQPSHPHPPQPQKHKRLNSLSKQDSLTRNGMAGSSNNSSGTGGVMMNFKIDMPPRPTYEQLVQQAMQQQQQRLSPMSHGSNSTRTNSSNLPTPEPSPDADEMLLKASGLRKQASPEYQQGPSEDLMGTLKQLQLFLATAPTAFEASQHIKKFFLPNEEVVSCILWNDLFHITGTDIIKCLTFRFAAFGRPVKATKKFEEGVFSDLRNLRPGVDSTLEEPRSVFLNFLHENRCIRTQKKQKVFYWFSVPHDELFMDALERDLKREMQGLETTTEPGIPLTYERAVELSSLHNLPITELYMKLYKTDVMDLSTEVKNEVPPAFNSLLQGTPNYKQYRRISSPNEHPRNTSNAEKPGHRRQRSVNSLLRPRASASPDKTPLTRSEAGSLVELTDSMGLNSQNQTPSGRPVYACVYARCQRIFPDQDSFQRHVISHTHQGPLGSHTPSHAGSGMNSPYLRQPSMTVLPGKGSASPNMAAALSRQTSVLLQQMGADGGGPYDPTHAAVVAFANPVEAALSSQYLAPLSEYQFPASMASMSTHTSPFQDPSQMLGYFDLTGGSTGGGQLGSRPPTPMEILEASLTPGLATGTGQVVGATDYFSLAPMGTGMMIDHDPSRSTFFATSNGMMSQQQQQQQQHQQQQQQNSANQAWMEAFTNSSMHHNQ